MNLVDTHIHSYTTIQRDVDARRQAEKREVWDDTISRRLKFIMDKLGTRLCLEIKLQARGSSVDDYAFTCEIFGLPCILTLITHTSELKNARLRFRIKLHGKEVCSAPYQDDSIGKALYVLKKQVDEILKPLAIQERVWFPYYYYELTYTALCHEEDSCYVDTFTADVTSEKPDEDGWYYVLNFAYASKETHARPTKFTNVVKIVRRLAEEPDHSRDRLFKMRDEETGDEYRVYRPRGGVEQA